MNLTRRDLFKASVAGLAYGEVLQPPLASAAAPETATALHDLSVRDLAARIRAKQLSPVELMQAILKRIDQVESKVRAFITITRDEALEAARSAEKEIMASRYRGPLHGIPFAVKDTFYTKGIKTTAATPVLTDFVPSFDSTVVARLKNAGAVLIGKTNLPEFSQGSFGNGTNNPWDLTRPPGGSSAGSAAGLAAGMFPMATGGDTGASIRGPAALCGVVGLKP